MLWAFSKKKKKRKGAEEQEIFCLKKVYIFLWGSFKVESLQKLWKRFREILDWSKGSARMRNYRNWIVTVWRRNGCWGGGKRGNVHTHTHRPFLHGEPRREPRALLTIHSHYTSGKKYYFIEQLTTSSQRQHRILPAYCQGEPLSPVM